MRKPLYTLFVFLMLKGCFYSSNEVFYVDIEPDWIAELKVETNFDTLSSVFIVDSVLFEYHLSVDTGLVYLTRLYFDDYLIYNKDTSAAAIWIDPYFIEENGHYELDMEVYYQTATGSLADRIQAEYAYWDTTWMVVLNREGIME